MKFRQSQKRDKETVIEKIMVTYYCGYLEKEITKEVSEGGNWNGDYEEHYGNTYVGVEIHCECGFIHELSVRDY